MPTERDLESEAGRNDSVRLPLIAPQGKSSSNDECSKDSYCSLWTVYLSTFVAVSGSYEFGSCVGYSAPTQSKIREDLGLSLTAYSIFGSTVTVGAMIGAVSSGRIADLIGRKQTMRMSAIFCVAGWLAVIFAQGALSLDIGRFCSGYGVGVISYVVPVFIAEITPKNLRGALATVNQLMICTGVSVSYIIGTFLSWRTLALNGLIPCAVLLLGLCFIPESPRWLAKVGRLKEFDFALRRLRGKQVDMSDEAEEIQDCIHNLQTLPKVSIQDLFIGRYARPVLVGVGLMAFQQLVGINGVIFYGSEIFVAAGFASGKVGTILMGCIQVPVTILGAVLMDKSGRRPLLMMSAAGATFACILTGVSLCLKSREIYLGWAPFIALFGILLYLGAFSLGLGAVPWVMMAEIFPINIKGTAGSLATLITWLGSWVVSFSFNFLMNWSEPGTFFLYATAGALTILFVAKVVPETKGRTLEEIHIAWSG